MVDLDELSKIADADLDELLKIAGAPNDARTRSKLELNLQLARGHCRLSKEERQTPAALFKQLDKSLTRTLILLQQLEKEPAWRDICFRDYISGEGMAVAVSAKEIFEGKLKLPRTPPSPRHRRPTLEVDGTLIAINIRAALTDIQGEIVRRALRPKRGQPVKVDKSVCVFYARHFFVHHSRHKASTDPKSRFSEFCESFYSAVSATTPQPGALAWHIRQELTKQAARRRA
jgi:hypothetical protein